LYNPTDSKKVESQKVFPKLIQKKFPKLDFDYYIYSPAEKENIIKKISNSNSKILFSTL
jgi:N-acetylglucosaminyldiphosphoundecaprenol N-acetyl-beta-D-mannosaminyltransferase